VELSAVETRSAVEPRFVAEFAGALVAESADTSQFAALSGDGGGFQLRAVDPPHAEVWLRHTHPLSLALSRDGRFAATSSYDAPGVRLWSLPDARVIREIPASPPSLLAFAADGRTLATASGLAVTLWNADSGARGGTITTRTRIRSLAFSGDGQLLAVESREGITLFRAAAPFEELATLATKPARGTASFCFSRDSQQLAVQSAAGGAVVWRLDALRRELAPLGMNW
jgi:WD40 repeat protein